MVSDVEIRLDELSQAMRVVERAGASPELTNVIVQLAERHRELQKLLPACSFCGSQLTPVVALDMGEGRSMLLCADCRRHVEAGRLKANPV